MTKNNSNEHKNYTREIRITIAVVAFTGLVWLLLGADMVRILESQLQAGDIASAGSQAVFMLVIALMQCSILVYYLARLGQLYRHRSHRVPARSEMMGLYDGKAPSLAVLVPSYKEDPVVVRKTLLSAALLDYPTKQVVLLIDDPPAPGNEADRALLENARQLVTDLNTDFRRYAKPFRAAWNDYTRRKGAERIDTAAEWHIIASLYDRAARCLDEIRADTSNFNHEDRWFIEQNLLAPAAEFRDRAASLRNQADRVSGSGGRAYLEREYFRLSRLFTAEISAFERKRYVNLSHEPNKAMNLNSYLGLMGKTVTIDDHADGELIRECRKGETGGYVPDADFVITLDADSLLSPDYALKLISVMTADGSERLAVVQTPYSAFPGAPGSIERIAGATTDIQYLVHQGFTSFNATFWVGANALLRKQALEDIAVTDTERGFPITRYIQDRTVIEDTESSVDMVVRGWSLFNFPERLAYSATPPDFGALLIQRRRWANGGLIIFPKFCRYVTRLARVSSRLGHALMGVHYLTSLATINLGILALLWFPVEEAMRSPWLPMAMIPYMLLYARDLVRIGYRARDVFGVYALNLLLVPVHLGGVFKSVAQIVTGKRTPFGRTPKIADRTAVPLFYLAACYGLLAISGLILAVDLAHGRWLHALFAGANGAILAYAILRFVGLRASVQDICLAYREWIERPARAPIAQIAEPVPGMPEPKAKGAMAK
jgi:cellulose synthase/poly-beta-1,6-N-acetylglucosamine synthase-like glycosyltransferase